jgi:hypothetical protein
MLETNRMNPTTELVQPARKLYLDLIERCLINTIYGDAYTDWRERGVEKNLTTQSGNSDATGPVARTP